MRGNIPDVSSYNLQPLESSTSEITESSTSEFVRPYMATGEEMTRLSRLYAQEAAEEMVMNDDDWLVIYKGCSIRSSGVAIYRKQIMKAVSADNYRGKYLLLPDTKLC